MITDLGQTTSIDILIDRRSLAGRRVLDVGCGDMAFSRQLVAAGASVLAIDPDAEQAAANRAAAATEPGLVFREAGADALPAEDASCDGVCFSFSLHHVPVDRHAAAFAEARRVLVPDGFLCVIEPTGSPLNDVMKLFHDEDRERAAAQASIRELALPAFEQHEVLRYHSHVQYDSFEDFADRFAGKTFNDGYTAADVRRPEVAAAYARAAPPDGRFESPKLMVLASGLRRED